jgi:hypothetical protein
VEEGWGKAVGATRARRGILVRAVWSTDERFKRERRKQQDKTCFVLLLRCCERRSVLACIDARLPSPDPTRSLGRENSARSRWESGARVDGDAPVPVTQSRPRSVAKNPPVAVGVLGLWPVRFTGSPCSRWWCVLAV